MNTRPRLTLALNTAESTLQLVLGICPEQTGSVPETTPKRRTRQKTGILCAQEWRFPSQGAELLAPLLRDSCARIGAKVHDIHQIACVNGPGSFTGLRLALASASGLARSTGATQGGLAYLPLLADNALAILGHCSPCLSTQATSAPAHAPERRAVVWVITHARQNLVHMQAFQTQTSRTSAIEAESSQPATPISDIAVVTVEEAAKAIACLCATHTTPPLLLGSGVTRNAPALSAALADYAVQPVFTGPLFDTPSAETLFRAALQTSYGRDDIAPAYVRPCDAEDNLEYIAGLLHIDAADARNALALKTQTAPKPDDLYSANPCEGQTRQTTHGATAPAADAPSLPTAVGLGVAFGEKNVFPRLGTKGNAHGPAQ